jgi:hypothetical protein
MQKIVDAKYKKFQICLRTEQTIGNSFFMGRGLFYSTFNKESMPIRYANITVSYKLLLDFEFVTNLICISFETKTSLFRVFCLWKAIVFWIKSTFSWFAFYHYFQSCIADDIIANTLLLSLLFVQSFYSWLSFRFFF